MPENDSKSNFPPHDDLPRDHIPERGEQTGPLDVPQQDLGENFVTLEDRMLARRSVPIRHMIPDDDALEGQSAQAEIREAAGLDSVHGALKRKGKRTSESIWSRRWRRFKALKRGYYAFIALVILYGLSFLLPLMINNKALYVSYNGSSYFPAVSDLFDFLPGVESFYPASTFGQTSEYGEGEAVYRKLKEEFEAAGGDNTVIMPLYPWDPNENDLTLSKHPSDPAAGHLLGTDDSGRDVLSRLLYGFNVSISFALVLTFIAYLIGIAVGSIMGFFGGKLDLIGQRFVEIWENLPFLYIVIIVSSIVQPNFIILVAILALFQWIGISYYIRGEFFREKSKDYVSAAISLGASTPSIIFKHILPNSLTPIITFYPFALIGGINVLVALDFLGFGLPGTVPSWGGMLNRGLDNLESWWLVVPPLAALFFTLMLVTFIGEAVREAFDPKVFSRLR